MVYAVIQTVPIINLLIVSNQDVVEFTITMVVLKTLIARITIQILGVFVTAAKMNLVNVVVWICWLVTIIQTQFLMMDLAHIVVTTISICQEFA